MKKINLKSLNLKEVEQLTREQLKNVIGGYTGGTGDMTDDGGAGSGSGPVQLTCWCSPTTGFSPILGIEPEDLQEMIEELCPDSPRVFCDPV